MTNISKGRLQPAWKDRRGDFDRRCGEDRRQMDVDNLPFPDRRQMLDRRTGDERRATDETASLAEQAALTPNEIRALFRPQ